MAYSSRTSGEMFAKVAVLFFWVVSAAIAQELPEIPHNTRQCVYVNTKVKCTYMTSEIDLEEELLSTTRIYQRTTELIIANSHFRFFVHDGFMGTTFRKIDIRDSSILSLSNSKLAFEGLEDYLENLVVDNTSFVNQWNWSQLKQLRNLTALTVTNSDLVYIPETMQNVSKNRLEILELSYNGITKVHERAFSALKELKYLVLEHNGIAHVQRTMLPDVNCSLEVLSLSYNLLQTLPTDMFVHMTRLKVLKLSGNLLWTIDEEIFGSIWHQLYVFSLSDSPLSCDCRLRWIANKRKKNGPKMIFSICQQPESLKGKFLGNLEKKHLWC